MNRPRNFKNRRVDLKMSSSTAVTSVVIGLIAGSCFKDSKIFSLILIIGAFIGG